MSLVVLTYEQNGVVVTSTSPDRLEQERVLQHAGDLGERREGTVHHAVEDSFEVRVGALVREQRLGNIGVRLGVRLLGVRLVFAVIVVPRPDLGRADVHERERVRLVGALHERHVELFVDERVLPDELLNLGGSRPLPLPDVSDLVRLAKKPRRGATASSAWDRGASPRTLYPHRRSDGRAASRGFGRRRPWQNSHRGKSRAETKTKKKSKKRVSNPQPSACEADVITARPFKLLIFYCTNCPNCP
jgi:hypothetical protein